MIAVDTNIVIAYLGDEPSVVNRIESAVSSGETVIVPTVVIAETFAYPYIDEALTTRIHNWLDTGVMIKSFDLPLAERSATIRRATKIKLTDCIIAATALAYGAPLATRDQQFKKVPDLTILAW
ncbi:PIN domain-containing protein [Candidatus Uhrbacteria bacterium]|nr:PIN domain-containing protein [Candidatus Uhrbacteria bacterium]